MSGAVGVTYATSDGTATAPSDYAASSGTPIAMSAIFSAARSFALLLLGFEAALA